MEVQLQKNPNLEKKKVFFLKHTSKHLLQSLINGKATIGFSSDCCGTIVIPGDEEMKIDILPQTQTAVLLPQLVVTENVLGKISIKEELKEKHSASVRQKTEEAERMKNERMSVRLDAVQKVEKSRKKKVSSSVPLKALPQSADVLEKSKKKLMQLLAVGPHSIHQLNKKVPNVSSEDLRTNLKLISESCGGGEFKLKDSFYSLIRIHDWYYSDKEKRLVLSLAEKAYDRLGYGPKSEKRANLLEPSQPILKNIVVKQKLEEPEVTPKKFKAEPKKPIAKKIPIEKRIAALNIEKDSENEKAKKSTTKGKNLPPAALQLLSKISKPAPLDSTKVKDTEIEQSKTIESVPEEKEKNNLSEEFAKKVENYNSIVTELQALKAHALKYKNDLREADPIDSQLLARHFNDFIKRKNGSSYIEQRIKEAETLYIEIVYLQAKL